EAAASSKACPAGASTSPHTAKPPTAAAVVALQPVTERYRWTGPGHQPATAHRHTTTPVLELQPMIVRRHTAGHRIPIVGTPQLVITLRPAPDPTHRPAATTNLTMPTRSITTATATNSHSDHPHLRTFAAAFRATEQPTRHTTRSEPPGANG